jgi:hypothetical protein
MTLSFFLWFAEDLAALHAVVAAGGQPFDAALDEFRNFCGIELHDSFLLSLVR